MKNTQTHVAVYPRDIYTAEGKRGANMAAHRKELRKALKRMSVDELIEDFLKHAPDVLGIEEPLERPDPSGPIAILTREELAVCELAGVDPHSVAQFCKDEKEGKTARMIMASTVGDQ